jgi:branched-chain amino acid transport system ATP-binding protein
MLELENIVKVFGENHVLNGVSLQVEKGKIYTLTGGNGTGKSTLFNIITGFIRPDNGTISYKSKQIQTLNPVKINSLGITRTFQDLRLITELSVRENILLAFKNNPGEKIYNAILPPRLFKEQYHSFAQRAAEILETVHLTVVADNLAGEISYGQQKLLTIGCCIANDADLLLLDEPVAGIDKDNYTRIFETLLRLKAEGKTIIQIEHNHGFVESLSDGIFFLYGGEASYYKDYNSFKNDELIKEVYLN